MADEKCGATYRDPSGKAHEVNWCRLLPGHDGPHRGWGNQEWTDPPIPPTSGRLGPLRDGTIGALTSWEPPQHVVALAVSVSTLSPCRSKRGSVIFSGDHIISNGYNFKPRGFDCDGSRECKATCRRDAIHAEQAALLAAGKHLAAGARMLHAKTVDGVLVPSGGPSCVQCSKLALACGVSGIWLYETDGWKWYPADEWHRLSIEAQQPTPPSAPEALVTRLREYVQHKPECECVRSKQIYGVTLAEGGRCTCGLRDLLTGPPSRPQAPTRR